MGKADCTLTLVSKEENGDKDTKTWVIDEFKSPNQVGSPEFYDDVLNYVIKHRTHADKTQKRLIEDEKPAGGETLATQAKKKEAKQPVMDAVPNPGDKPNPAAVAAKGRAQAAEKDKK